MMEEEYISFETAKMLDGIEFHCVGCYTENGSTDALDVMNAINNKEKLYPRITQSILSRWLREKYNIYVSVQIYDSVWSFQIVNLNNKSEEQHGFLRGSYDSYEEALEEGLQYALSLIK